MAESNVSYIYMWSLQNHNDSFRARTSEVASRPPPISPLDPKPRSSTSPFDNAQWAILRHASAAAVTNKCASAANGMTLACEPFAAPAMCGPTGKLPEVDLRGSVEDGADKLQLVKPSPGFDFSSWSLATNAWIRQKALDALFPHDRLVYKDVSSSLNSKYESIF